MKRVFYKFQKNKKKTTGGNMRATKGCLTQNNKRCGYQLTQGEHFEYAQRAIESQIIVCKTRSESCGLFFNQNHV